MLATIVLVISVTDSRISDLSKEIDGFGKEAVDHFPDARFASVRLGVTQQALDAGFEATALGDEWQVYFFPSDDKRRRLIATTDSQESAMRIARALGANQIQTSDGRTVIWLTSNVEGGR